MSHVKACARCHEIKPIGSFWGPDKRGYYCSYCYACDKERRYEYHQRLQSYQRIYYSKNRRKLIKSSASRYAKENDILNLIRILKYRVENKTMTRRSRLAHALFTPAGKIRKIWLTLAHYIIKMDELLKYDDVTWRDNDYENSETIN
jgi:hypothetical protein